VKSLKSEEQCPEWNGVYHSFLRAQAASSVVSIFSVIHEQAARLFPLQKHALTNLFHLSKIRFVLGVR
jgi:hypothetical protein